MLGAKRRAEELLLETGDELARTDHQFDVLGRPAFEGLAADLADKVDDHLIAIARLGRLAGARLVQVQAPALVADPLFQLGLSIT